MSNCQGFLDSWKELFGNSELLHKMQQLSHKITPLICAEKCISIFELVQYLHKLSKFGNSEFRDKMATVSKMEIVRFNSVVANNATTQQIRKFGTKVVKYETFVGNFAT